MKDLFDFANPRTTPEPGMTAVKVKKNGPDKSGRIMLKTYH